MTDQAIDFDHLDRYVAGDAALRDEVLTIFEGQVARCLRLLNPEGPNEEWRSIAHALKGASRGIGAWTVGAYCERAEKMTGTDEDVFEVRVALKEQIQSSVDEALTAIRELRRTA
ncbi:Hpt domain-containing protein [Parvularcula sp. ZS-1/3]|uniref:Hpt domain-containing protein n=1 Tax=Parvularcula mediterranea TaxID=2732508 RepID=A0A7Y3W477_9PROT|nr:Hpt domain-containing protein [Parvularcula mediterranea]NNU15188.1 Hpt domain-containing protein [Parvularcula mediterranea]